ncbi:MAG: hypothetical protein ABEK59_10200 [Halobacteria archaeon]
MESEIDTSILNTVNIKRFTKSVLENHGASIDRSNSAKWQVEFPDKLSRQLDRQQGTLVFDAADRERGAGDLLVQPGTTVFSALLDLVQKPGSIGSIRLTENELQVNPPTVLQESDLSVEAIDFTEQASDFALAFHFRVEFETPAAFHREEMVSVTIDPETQERIPELTERLTSHLPQLLQQNNEHPSRSISDTKVHQSFQEGQQAVIDYSRPLMSELREEAEENAGERIEEISEWYEQRRNELDQQLQKQREEIRKWKRKRRKARKNSTRIKYIENRKEAEEELEQLKTEIQDKKQELDAEESEEVDEVIDRNNVEVDISLLGVTEITYDRGKLVLDLTSNHTDTKVEVSYLPATDDFRDLDCDVCSRDLTDGILPRLCMNGHLTGDPCSVTCRNCGLTYCDDCEVETQFTTCLVCWESICRDCLKTCMSCKSAICQDHNDVCNKCSSITCHLCGENCSTCNTFYCDQHLIECPDCSDLHCEEDIRNCSVCSSSRCEACINQCSDCGDWICSEHSTFCATCGDALCDNHIEFCALCGEKKQGKRNAFCHKHGVECLVGGEVVCSNHRISRTLGSGYICQDHYDVCGSCGVGYSTDELVDGKCTACQSIGEVNQQDIPSEVTSEFRSVKAGSNDAYMVILGKKLFGRNKIVVYDIRSGDEVDRHNAGMLKQLFGGI